MLFIRKFLCGIDTAPSPVKAIGRARTLLVNSIHLAPIVLNGRHRRIAKMVLGASGVKSPGVSIYDLIYLPTHLAPLKSRYGFRATGHA